MRKGDMRFVEMYELYLQGYSLAETGRQYGVTRQSVYAGFKLRGYKLRKQKQLPFILCDGLKWTRTSKGYLRATTSRNKTIFLHRHNWEKHNGEIPENYDVHHLDGDKEHNKIENLACLSKAEHTSKYSPHCNQHKCNCTKK